MASDTCKLIIEKLNIMYESDDKEAYEKQVETLKSVGYRVFRNSKGYHKVEYNTHYFQQVFGGEFGRMV